MLPMLPMLLDLARPVLRPALIACLLVTACGKEGSQGKLTPIQIGTSSQTPLHAAIGEILERGDILANHGLRGVFREFERGRDQHEQSVRGEVDATFSCEEAAMVHLQALSGSVLTGSAGSLGSMALVVPAESSYRSVADLMGRDLLLVPGASANLALSTWLEQAGIPDLVLVRESQGEDAIRALVEGRAQAAVLWDPWLSKARQERPLRTLAETPFWSVVLTFEDHQDAATWTRFHRALEEALAWARDHQEQSILWASERSRLDPEVVRTVLNQNDYIAGRRDITLALPQELQQRLARCERWELLHHKVDPAFSLAACQRATP